MIRFNCHCTHEFLVPDDQAGGMVQCPKCSRLNDVPTLGDLENLEDGGIFKIGEGPKAPGKNVLPDAARAFTREKHDDRGQDIDMRPSVEEFLNLGTDEIPLSMKDEERPGAPKYDPLTGELVESIQLMPSDQANHPDPHSIPIATRAVSYAAGDLHLRVTPGTILLHLFQPVNLFVMLFVVFAHVLLQGTLSIVCAGIFFAAPLVIIVGGLLVSHYGIVIEEIGVSDANELPRPLRDFSFSEDMWRPWVRFNLAILLCFWPEIYTVRLPGPVGTGLLASCMVFGLYFFPAILVTALNGDTYLNLRPDRVIGVIRACGSGYFASVIAFTVGGAIYLGGIGLLDISIAKFFLHPSMLSGSTPMFGIAIGSPALLLGIYLFHFACWHLGLLYRANHERFPWILQRHVQSRRTDTLAQLELARRTRSDWMP